MKVKVLLSMLILNSFLLFNAKAGTTVSGTIQAPGPNGSTTTRSYRLYIPSSYSSSTSIPLIFNFHGTGGTSAGQQSLTGFDAIADTANFMVVYPQALTQVAGAQSGSVAWTVTGTVADAQNSDIKFVSMLLDTLKSKYNINTCRVYATGFSSGGYMTYEVGCYLNSLFAAIAPVSGIMLTQHYMSRTLTHPTPVFHTHGDNDGTVSYTGGTGQEPVDSLVVHFAKYNSCTGPTTTTLTNSCTTDGCTVQSNIYSGGTNGSKVQKYRIVGGTHSWPSATCGSSSGTNGDYGGAALAIWKFFKPFCLGDLTGGSCTSPSITSQPSSKTVCSGSNTNFVVAASGSGLNYQWQVDQGSGFNNVSNSAPYSGATTSTLTITNASSGLNGYKYKCIVGAGSCATSVTSNTVTLTISTAPTATISGSKTICSSAATTLTVTLTGSSSWAYTYAINGSNQPQVSSSSSPSTFTASVAGTYSLISVSDNSGCTGSASGSAIITQNTDIITANKTETCNTAGTKYIVEFDISGGTPAYTVTGGTGTLTSSTHFKSDSVASGASYSFTVTDVYACASAPVVSGAKTCTTSSPCNASATISGNATICSGASAIISVALTGTAPYTFTYAIGGTNQSPITTSLTTYTFSASTPGVYTIASVTDNTSCTGTTSGSATITQNSAITTSNKTEVCNSSGTKYVVEFDIAGGTPAYTVTGGTGTLTSSTHFKSDSITSGASYSFTVNDAYVCANTPVSGSKTCTASPSCTASLIISGSDTICSGAAVTFTATATSGGTSPAYQWTLNNINVGTGNTYATSSLVNGDIVACILTSNASCVSTATVTSNSITMNVTPTVTPSVSISISGGSNTTCAGSQVTFSAAPTNGGATPAYAWSVNGSTVGTNSNSYISSSLADGDAVACVLTSDANCLTAATATSNTITMSITTNTITPSVTIAASSSSICAGTAVTFTATPSNAGSAQSYQWMVGGNPVGTNSTTYTDVSLTNGQVVSCSMTATLSCGSSTTGSNSVTMNVTSTVTPGVSISISSGSNPTCAGQAVIFTATPTGGGTAPGYVWSVNGGSVGTTNTYNSSSLANGDVVSCVLTSNANCITSATATSSGITMTTTAVVAPSITIAGPNSFCSGTAATYTATPTNGGTSPTYQWILSGNPVGTNSPTYSNGSLTNGQQVSCVITSNSSCASSAPVASNTITMTVLSTVTPAVSIAITSGTNPSAPGQSITFTASPSNGGTSPSYQWQVNGSTVGTGSTYTSSSLTSGDAVTCVLTSNAACATSTTATSNTITITIAATAVITNTTTVHVINTAMAKVKSNVISDGGFPVTAKGTVWSTSPNPTIALATQTTHTGGTGAFTDTITGLQPATTYYVRTYATNANGTVYSNEVVYTTPPVNTCSPDPSVTLATPGIFPKSLPPVDTTNLTINQTFTYSVPFTYTNSNGEVVNIDSSFLTGITNLPAGLSYKCGRPNCIFYPGEIGCFVVSGTLPKGNNQSYSTEFTVTDYGVIHTKKYGDQALETYSPNYIADTTVFIVGNGGIMGVASFDQSTFEIIECSPNPFNNAVTIKFSSPESGNVDFYINDIYGREVYRTAVHASSGINTINYSSDELAAGSYYFTVGNNSKRITKMMIAIK